jgi:hypothetical protein
MTTTMHESGLRNLCTRLQHSRWTVPVFSVSMGLLMLLLFTHAGDWRSGVWALGIMTAFAALVLLGGRSETIKGLRGDGRDERIALIDLRATAVSGFVLILCVIAGFLAEIARGHDGSPYAQLAAVAGLAYIVAIAVQRLRS